MQSGYFQRLEIRREYIAKLREQDRVELEKQKEKDKESNKKLEIRKGCLNTPRLIN